MKLVVTLALLHLCLSATAAVSGGGSNETVITAAPGDVAILPCFTVGNVTPSLTTWMKNGEVIIRGGGSPPDSAPVGQRLAVLHDGSLNIKEVTPGDEGSYLCNSTLPGNRTFQTGVLLQVTSGPENVSMSIGPATTLSNGTLTTYRGSTVSFNCSGSSYPAQQLTWAFRGDLFNNDSLVSANGSLLEFKIEDIQPSAQGLYSCRARNIVSHQAVNKSTQLLVYYVPNRHPDCMWTLMQDPSHIQFNCSWLGAYPTPLLRWHANQAGQGDHIYVSRLTDNLSLTLNRSQLFKGQMLKCTAQHRTIPPGKEKSCWMTLESPYPQGDPLVTALEGTSITLTCTETTSKPPANTTWRKGLKQDEIIPGSKYILSRQGADFKLTITNVSKDDEGVYFCRSENPLSITELEVFLTVKNSSVNTGVVIGIFIAVLIAGAAVVVAKTVYSSRHQICLGGGFGQVGDDRGDVLNLVESDDEQVFQDSVPRLPPITNGHHTTLVQIHRIPSSDHEETETADTSPEQQEDTIQAEEPEDLVSF
ncbi:V-set and immunoglobulin domain-containing protein 10 isoform X2 [Mastacembelus armatus]|uniref:V-set and immunoglobulin domain containing 10 n=1 Tax=Mastacembelus armatus TaxID=205130 RepID=A0A3Q3KYG6_9TELE|nr:V-set and immunoglobulin domain-containing protein 10 isoform X2 [Mastacembelus armatus]